MHKPRDRSSFHIETWWIAPLSGPGQAEFKNQIFSMIEWANKKFEVWLRTEMFLEGLLKRQKEC